MTCQFVLFVPSWILLQKLNVVYVSLEKLFDFKFYLLWN
jgi:hypothetical protein